LPPDSDTPIQLLSKEFPQSYSNGNQLRPNDVMSPKEKKQYGNMAGGFGPYGPPIYQQPQLPLPYPNGYGMNSFSNQMPYNSYYSNLGDGDQQQQQQQQQQQLDPAYAYSNSLAYYPPQGADTDVTTVAAAATTSTAAKSGGGKQGSD
jgi:hypothetical protein